MSQLAKKDQQTDLRAVLAGPQMKQRFADVLPHHLSPDRYVRVALAAISRTPKLLDCTQESLLRCLLDLSALGLEPDGRRAHLIPYGKDCTLIIDWKGLAELAMRSGVIAKLHADIVCENDVFDYNLGEIVKHAVDFKHPRGAMYAAYAMAQTKDGPVFVAVLTKEEIDGIRKRSRAGNSGPWVSDYNEMAKKTAFRRLAKWLPLSAEFRDAIEKDGDVLTERDVSPPRHTARAKPLDPFQALPVPPADADAAQDVVEEATAEDALAEFHATLAEAQTGKALAEAADWAEKHLTGPQQNAALEAVNNRANELGLVWDGEKGAFVEP